MAGNYEEILMPLLAGLKAVPRDPKQEREIRKLNYQIEELRKQSYMLRQVLVDGNIGSAVFIERRNQMDSELETLIRRRQLLEADQFFEPEIMQNSTFVDDFSISYGMTAVKYRVSDNCWPLKSAPSSRFS